MEADKNIRVSKEELDNKLSNVIIRQTNYTKEESIKKLEEYNYNVKQILLDYHGIKEKTKDNKKSPERYDLIRNFLDQR